MKRIQGYIFLGLANTLLNALFNFLYQKDLMSTSNTSFQQQKNLCEFTTHVLNAGFKSSDKYKSDSYWCCEFKRILNTKVLTLGSKTING